MCGRFKIWKVTLIKLFSPLHLSTLELYLTDWKKEHISGLPTFPLVLISEVFFPFIFSIGISKYSSIRVPSHWTKQKSSNIIITFVWSNILYEDSVKKKTMNSFTRENEHLFCESLCNHSKNVKYRTFFLINVI